MTLPNKQWHAVIESTREKFSGSGLDFTQEQIFATQQLMNNSYLLDLAMQDPTSLKMAMYNVAAVGLSLSPQLGLAYLVPRKPRSGLPAKITLDISYRGLIAIGVETGAIRWAKAELVYANDEFLYHGPVEKPRHLCNPFSTNRGAVIGGYCIAELGSGGVMVEPMSRADMDKIRDASEAFKKGAGPWMEWEDQMQMKSIVKRASKWWPKASARMAKALQILNEDNGEGLAQVVREQAAEEERFQQLEATRPVEPRLPVPNQTIPSGIATSPIRSQLHTSAISDSSRVTSQINPEARNQSTTMTLDESHEKLFANLVARVQQGNISWSAAREAVKGRFGRSPVVAIMLDRLNRAESDSVMGSDGTELDSLDY